MREWSSRRNAVNALGVLGALGALGLLGSWLSRRRPTQREPCGPLLAYRGAVAASEAPARRGDAVWLAVMTLPAAERDRVLELMSSLLTAMEARTSPATFDWISGDLREDFAKVRGWLLPVMNAAEAVIQQRWAAHDVAVRILREDASPEEGEDLVASWPSSTPEDELARRARFAAWALTGATLVEGLSGVEREGVAGALRTRIPTPESTIAVVLDSELQARRDAPAALGSLQRACRARRNVIRRVQEPDAQFLAALADADEAPLLPWLPLESDELLIVPRLGALARSSNFRREVAEALSAARARARIACGPAP